MSCWETIIISLHNRHKREVLFAKLCLNGVSKLYVFQTFSGERLKCNKNSFFFSLEWLNMKKKIFTR